jgi:CRISPR-associated endoribonuclease Cas6
MPTRFVLELEPDRGGPAVREPTPGQVHGLACALLDRDSAAHRAQEKPWAAWPVDVEQDDGRARWSLHWLRDDCAAPTDRLGVGSRVRLGGRGFTLRSVSPAMTGYAALADRVASRADMWFQSPTYFSRNGRFYPLPDPVLVFRGLAARWNARQADVSTSLPEELLRQLTSVVAISAYQLQTTRVAVGAGERGAERPAFTGWARFAVPRGAEEAARRAFAALVGFAEFAGVGAMTTHGLGAVSAETRE